MWNSFIKYIASQLGNPTGWTGKMLTRFLNVLNRKLYRRVECLLDIREGEQVLEIGFGNGRLIGRLCRRFSPGLICGIDISADMVDEARRFNRVFVKKGRVELMCGDVVHLSFPDACFDKIYTINTLYFWTEPLNGFSEIKRVMKPGAMFLLVGYEKEWLDQLPYTHYGFHKYSEEAIRDMVENTGLVLKERLCIEKNKSYCLIIGKV